MSELQVVELILASGALGLHAPRVRRRARNPKLQLFVPRGAGPQLVRVGNRLSMVHAVRLKNLGPTHARGCRATLEAWEYWNGDLWRPHPGFGLALPLSWHVVGARARIDLAPGTVSDDLPLVAVLRGAARLRIATPLQITSGILLEYPPGRYRLTVTVRGSGTPEAVATERFEVEFGGTWEDLHLREASGSVRRRRRLAPGTGPATRGSPSRKTLG